jgi:hypothetical protein
MLTWIGATPRPQPYRERGLATPPDEKSGREECERTDFSAQVHIMHREL